MSRPPADLELARRAFLLSASIHRGCGSVIVAPLKCARCNREASAAEILTPAEGQLLLARAMLVHMDAQSVRETAKAAQEAGRPYQEQRRAEAQSRRPEPRPEPRRRPEPREERRWPGAAGRAQDATRPSTARREEPAKGPTDGAGLPTGPDWTRAVLLRPGEVRTPGNGSRAKSAYLSSFAKTEDGRTFDLKVWSYQGNPLPAGTRIAVHGSPAPSERTRGLQMAVKRSLFHAAPAARRTR